MGATFYLKTFEYQCYKVYIMKLALVPTCRYNCDEKWPYVNVCAKFH